MDVRYLRTGRAISWLCVLGVLLLSTVGCDGDAPRPDEGAHGPVMQEGGRTEPAREIQNDPEVLSPPILMAPALACGTAVRVRGFVPGAQLTILVDGTDAIGSGVGIDPEGEMVPLDEPLQAGWRLTAVQEIDGATSSPSEEVVVQHFTEQYPDGLLAPDFPALPLYRCGVATVVNNLPEGGEVKVFSDAQPAPIGQASGVWSRHSVGINPPFETGHQVTAQSSICDEHSPISAPPQIVQEAPSSLPAPDVPELYEDGSIVVVGNLVNGSLVRVRDQANGDLIAGGGAPSSRVRFNAANPVSAGQTLLVEQQLCDVVSPTVTVTVRDCSDLPPPTVIAPMPGDTQLQLSDVVAGSRVLVIANGEEIGDGGGSLIQLVRPVEAGETLWVVQILGGCQSSQAYVVGVGTGLNDPGSPGRCRVESFTYGDRETFATDISEFFNSPSVPVSMSEAPRRGHVFYPTDASGPYPVFMVVHGNSAPADAGSDGYHYLLEHLASHCIVAVSVDQYFLNGFVSGEMGARGLMLLRNLQLLRQWSQDPGHLLFARANFDLVMLAGHSRGGEAAVVAQGLNQMLHNAADPDFNFGFGIRSLYAIAPVDNQISASGGPIAGLPLTNVRLRQGNYFIIHGSHDGDVADFQGYRTYDRAFPVDESAAGFKALRFVHGANHKQFNTHWDGSTPPDHPPTASSTDVRNLTRTCVTAYAFATLKNWQAYKAFLKREVTFPSVPVGMTVVRQYQDPSRVFINHHEEDMDPATGSIPGVSNSVSGSVNEWTVISFDTRGVPYWLWQETQGLLLGWNASNARLHVSLDESHANLISDHSVLGFRIGQVYDPGGSINPPGVDKDLHVRLVGSGWTGPAARVGDYVRLVSPEVVTISTPSGPWETTKTMMSSVRIPWSHLLPDQAEQVGSGFEIRFELDQQAQGLVVIDEIQASD